MANAGLRPVGYNPNESWRWVGNPSSDPTEEPESSEGDENNYESLDGDDDYEADDEEVVEDSAGKEEMEYNPEDEMFPIEYCPCGSDPTFRSWRLEYARKWKHFERQEMRRLRRGISPAQLFRHPGIEQTMWTPNTTSSEEPDSDGDDHDDSH